MTRPTVQESVAVLLDSIGPGPIARLHPGGNLGDQLINAGQDRLLRNHRINRQAPTLVVGGSGGWCRTFHSMPRRVAEAEARGDRRIIVLPSTYEVAHPAVADFLAQTEATLFAREARSAADTGLPLAHCPSFFFNYRPYTHRGRGKLIAFREDRETGGTPVPVRNRDLSRECRNLREWLKAIAEVNEVHTDRAHVMIAAALMGKRVRYRPGSYFKVQALAETWLADFDVEAL